MLVGRAKRPCQPSGTPPVAGSRPSKVRLWMTPSVTAASATVRPCGPTVSWVCEIGTTPARLVSPTVGLMPTTPLALAGHTMLPSVSVPRETVEKLADSAAPDPELEPQGLRSSPYGLWVWPPTPDQPLMEKNERKLAHSDRLVLPRITAPPARRLAAMVESRRAGRPCRPSDPAVVCILSPVSMLALSSTGMPCSGPSTLPLRRIASIWRAIARASGLISMSALTPSEPSLGWSSFWIRSMYARVSCSDVRRPEAMACCSCETVASRNGKSSLSLGSAAAASGDSNNKARRILPAMRDVMFYPPVGRDMSGAGSAVWGLSLHRHHCWTLLFVETCGSVVSARNATRANLRLQSSAVLPARDAPRTAFPRQPRSRASCQCAATIARQLMMAFHSMRWSPRLRSRCSGLKLKAMTCPVP